MLAALFLFAYGAPWAGAIAQVPVQSQPLETFDWDRLDIVTKSGTRHAFRVEMAITSNQQSQGLQWRKNLAEDAGMLFDFGSPKPASFWMKNTFISLDMVFIAGNGEIVKIVRNTLPLSFEVIPSDVPVRAVLEVRAGTAARLGFKPGDRVEHRIFQ